MIKLLGLLLLVLGIISGFKLIPKKKRKEKVKVLKNPVFENIRSKELPKIHSPYVRTTNRDVRIKRERKGISVSLISIVLLLTFLIGGFIISLCCIDFNNDGKTILSNVWLAIGVILMYSSVFFIKGSLSDKRILAGPKRNRHISLNWIYLPAAIFGITKIVSSILNCNCGLSLQEHAGHG